MIMTVTKDNFEAEVLQSDKPVLVDFWANWCGYCKMLSPELEQVAEVKEDMKFCKLNTDENTEIAMRYGVMSLPTLLVFQKGEVVNTLIGYRRKEELLDALK